MFYGNMRRIIEMNKLLLAAGIGVLSFALIFNPGGNRSYGAVSQPDIVTTRLDRIYFTRVDSGTPKIVFELKGSTIDSNGDIVKEIIEYHTWDELPANWRTDLLPILKGISKDFNNRNAVNNVETWE